MADQSDVAQALKPGELLIFGRTRSGKRFRPSDWDERLASLMAPFRPPGSGRAGHLGYSPYCLPEVVGGERCVVVRPELEAIEPRAWRFVLGFARDNDLETVQACVIDPAAGAADASAALPSPAPANPSGASPR